MIRDTHSIEVEDACCGDNKSARQLRVAAILLVGIAAFLVQTLPSVARRPPRRAQVHGENTSFFRFGSVTTLSSPTSPETA